MVCVNLQPKPYPQLTSTSPDPEVPHLATIFSWIKKKSDERSVNFYPLLTRLSICPGEIFTVVQLYLEPPTNIPGFMHVKYLASSFRVSMKV